jgi:hypothetical protein
VRWDAFEQACPEIAALAVERFRRDQLVMVGTLRRDGSPRISPNEVDLAAGRLFVSMMWRSRKALDLLRDPRVVVHSVVSDRMGSEGDFKLYGRAVAVDEPERRARYRATIKARIDWEPEEPNYHVFAVDVDSAGFVTFAQGNRYWLAWDPERGLRRGEQRES